MAKDANDQIVIAVFDNAAAAESAVGELKSWDKANDQVKLGAIGLLSKGEDGGVESKVFGTPSTGKGAKTGLVLGIIAAILSGGVTLLGGLVVGGGLGGLIGKLHKHGLGISDEDLKKLGGDLDGGKAALVVACDADEADATTAQLATLGGVVKAHEVVTEVIEEAAEAIVPDAEAPAASA